MRGCELRSPPLLLAARAALSRSVLPAARGSGSGQEALCSSPQAWASCA